LYTSLLLGKIYDIILLFQILSNIARVAHQSGLVSVVVVYAPNNSTDVQDKERFFDQLSSLINTIPLHDELIFTGNFNAVSGKDRSGHKQVVRSFGSSIPQDNTGHFLLFCAMKRLYVLNSWFKRKKFTAGRGSPTLIPLRRR